jgi:ArsR family transcriptional regulator
MYRLALSDDEKSMLTEISEQLKTLGHPIRLMIVALLKNGEVSVGAIAERLGLPLRAVSQNLRMMERVGLLRARREGRSILYSLIGPQIKDICQAICCQMERQIGASSQRLASFERLRNQFKD